MADTIGKVFTWLLRALFPASRHHRGGDPDAAPHGDAAPGIAVTTTASVLPPSLAGNVVAAPAKSPSISNPAPATPATAPNQPIYRHRYTRPYVPGSHTGLIHPYFDTTPAVPAPHPPPDAPPPGEQRRRRRRRRTLWLAAHGIDLTPGRIHGVRVRVRVRGSR